MQSEQLIQNAIEQTRQIINHAERLKNNDLRTLTRKENPGSWSILECLEHLNLYGDFYLPEIEHAIKNSYTKNDAEFKSSWLGNYFAKSMLPKEHMKKMKTFKDKNPLNAQLDKRVIERFIHQQIEMIELLTESEKISLNKVKIKISISRLIKLKLGDTFQFVINHNIRHMKQIERIEDGMKNDLT